MFITMPQLGETVTEGTIVQWYKTVGDPVAEDEALFEVSTDKVDTEVPAAIAGVLTEILVGEGETAPVGAQLAVVSVEGEGEGSPGTSATATAPSPAPGGRAPHPAAVPAAGRPPSDVELAPGARITRADVEERLQARTAPLARSAAAVPAAGPTAVAGEGDRIEPFSAIRRRTGTHLRASIETAAHTLVVMQADYTRVAKARDAVKDSFRSREGFGLTYLPFVARAAIDALREFPRVNASVGDDALIVHASIHLGVAVDLDFEGLIVPVVREAAGMRLRTLAHAIHERGAAAHAGTLTPGDVTGATFTITNAGGYGTLLTAPIISQPQVAILSTDGVAARPVAVTTGDGYGIAVHPVGNLSLSFDHRAFDGAYASAFLRRTAELLETRHWAEELA